MRIIAKNKKARFDYDISTTWQAGIILTGYEVKACKMDHCSITEAIVFPNPTTGNLEIKGMNIPLYSKANHQQIGEYEPKRDRKLLVSKKEYSKIMSQVSQGGGTTLIPLQVIELKNRRIKIIIGLAKRRRKVEKRQLIKERDISRQMEKEINTL